MSDKEAELLLLYSVHMLFRNRVAQMHLGSIRLNSSEANDDDSIVDNVGEQKNEYLLESVPTEQKFQCVTVILDTRL